MSDAALAAIAVIVFVIIAVAVVGVIVGLVRGAGQSAGRSVAKEPLVPQRPKPIVNEFHVSGDTASTVFAVPLGTSEAGEHLKELLCASAVEYVRDKKTEGLPLDEVRHIQVSAMRGQEPEVLCTVDLPDPGVLPDRDEKVLVEPSQDPIAAVHSVIADATVAPQTSGDIGLEPIAETIELSGPTDAHLRSIGVDPASMDLDDLVLGLLRVSGYDVHLGRSGMSGLAGVKEGKADVYGLMRDGKSTMLVILNHDESSHPELDDSVLARFAVEMAQINPDQAIFVTDKYSPYSLYEREKRDKRCLYITRERLQAFVDSFGMA